MAGVRSKPSASGRYQGFFIDENKKKRYFVGSTSKRETLQIARKLEDDARQVRLGYREPRQTHFKHRERPFTEVVTEYLEWGKAQGGRKGRPWSMFHASRKGRDLSMWTEKLGLKVLGDLDGALPSVEKAIQGFRKEGKAGKTIANIVESLQSFCLWCAARTRKYLAEDPLADLADIDTTPESTYRALTIDETYRLWKTIPDYLRPTYVLALLTGLRANELRSLTRAHLDTVNNGLRLEAAWTKNREPGFQPLPPKFVKQLATFADSGIVPGLYQQFARTLTTPKDPLVFVNSHPARELDGFLKQAGIPKTTAEGKLAFHALRTSFVTFTYECGASDQEAQELARHNTPGLTANVYARTRNERLVGITNRIAETVIPGGLGAPVVHETGASVTPEVHKCLPQQALTATETQWRRGDSNPRPEMVQDKHLRA
jgi:integrase